MEEPNVFPASRLKEEVLSRLWEIGGDEVAVAELSLMLEHIAQHPARRGHYYSLVPTDMFWWDTEPEEAVECKDVVYRLLSVEEAGPPRNVKVIGHLIKTGHIGAMPKPSQGEAYRRTSNFGLCLEEAVARNRLDNLIKEPKLNEAQIRYWVDRIVKLHRLLKQQTELNDE